MTVSATLAAEPARDALDMACLERLLGYNLRLSHTVVCRDFIARLKAIDLTQRQGAVLMLIDANPGCSQISLSTALETDRATIMDVIDRLQGRGLIERRASTVDRRRQDLYLTPAGREFLKEAVVQVDNHDKGFRELFTASELSQFFGFLQRIAARP